MYKLIDFNYKWFIMVKYATSRRKQYNPIAGLACIILFLFLYFLKDLAGPGAVGVANKAAVMNSREMKSVFADINDLCDAESFFAGYFSEVKDLDEFLKDHNGKIEGHSGLVDMQHRTYHALFCRNGTSIAEIGFNAGHSAMLMLMSNPSVRVQSFDNARHAYAKQAFQYLKEKFPNRSLEIEWGDSAKTVPLFHAHQPDIKFDIVIVDGGHEFDVAIADMINLRLLSHPNTLLIVDDSPCRAWCCPDA